MLLRQHFCRSHHRALTAVFKGAGEQCKCNHGLAAAHVTLDQTRHGPIGLHICQRLPQHAILRTGQLIRQLVQKGLHNGPIRLERTSHAGGAIKLPHGDAEKQQILKRLAAHGLRKVVHRLWEVRMIESFRVGRHAELREQALRQRVLQIQIPRFPCLAHQAGIGARRHILNGRIERLYAMST